MYKNITLVAFISAFMLSACGGGSDTTPTDPVGNGSSSKSSLTAASSKSSLVASSSKKSVASSSIASSVTVAISSLSTAPEPFSSAPAVASSSVAASSIVIVPVSSLAASSVAPSSVAASSLAASSVKSSSSAVASSIASSVKSSSSIASSIKSSSSIALSSSSAALSSSSAASSGPASIYHVRGTFNNWTEGTLMSRVGSTDIYEYCVNFAAGDAANGGPRFKIDPNGAWGADAVPASDYLVAAGWVKITYNSTTKAVSAQQNLPANCVVATSSSSIVASSSVKSSSSIASSSVAPSSSSVKSSSSITASSSVKSSSSLIASSSVRSSSSIASSSVAPSSSSVASSSVAASSSGPHFPGSDCNTCHTVGGQAASKIFTVSGTVYKNDRTTILPGAIIVLMDTQNLNEVVRMVADSSGNFYTAQSLGGLALQDLHPQAIGPTTTKKMAGAPGAGSCNTCHTLEGDAGDVIWTR